MSKTAVILSATLFASLAGAQEVAPELGQGWLPEFNLAARQILALAEATPAGKFGWRPAPGVRSISEVYMHIALGNFSLLSRAGVKVTAVDFSKLPRNPETSIADKGEVIRWLKMSFDTVAQAYPSADKTKKLKFFEKDATADGVFLRILVHNHEHMGQSIAYARMNGIVPPWSK